MKTLLLLLIFSFSAFAQSDIAQELARAAKEHNNIRRLEVFSRNYLGKPYGLNGPLGEGADGRYDQDPLWRFDTFDCTTYVETMMALALARTPVEFETHLRDIRYEDGRIDYLARNHFTSLQWVPNNIANGYLVDLTQRLAPKGVMRVARAQINQPGWYAKKKLTDLRAFDVTPEALSMRWDEWKAEGTRLAIEEATINYIPIDWVVPNPAFLKTIPNGSIVNFVRPNWDLTETAGTHLNVSHQGFIFQHAGQTWLRHASPSGTQTVREELLLDYLRKYVNHPTLKGIHLMGML